MKTLMRFDGSPGARDALKLACLLSRASDADLAIIAGPAGYDDALRSLPYGFRPELVSETPSPGVRVFVVGAGQAAADRVPGSRCPVAIAPRGFHNEVDAGLRVIAVADDRSPEARDAVAIAESLTMEAGSVVRVIVVDGELDNDFALRAGAPGLLVAPQRLAGRLLDGARFPVLVVPPGLWRSTEREPVAAPDGPILVLG